MNLVSNRPSRKKRPVITTAITLLVALNVVGCSKSGPATPAAGGRGAAIALLQGINSSAQTCWVKSGDADFRPYRVIPELDTRTGTPRLLIVNAKKAQGLPELVIEAKGTPPQLSAYGPLGSTELGPRIRTDVNRWAGGSSTCS